VSRVQEIVGHTRRSRRKPVSAVGFDHRTPGQCVNVEPSAGLARF
jgi:hypothetical protein